jgi:hypothetical protein
MTASWPTMRFFELLHDALFGGSQGLYAFDVAPLFS